MAGLVLTGAASGLQTVDVGDPARPVFAGLTASACAWTMKLLMPWRGSVLMVSGIPSLVCSAIFWTLLVHSA